MSEDELTNMAVELVKAKRLKDKQLWPYQGIFEDKKAELSALVTAAAMLLGSIEYLIKEESK